MPFEWPWKRWARERCSGKHPADAFVFEHYINQNDLVKETLHYHLLPSVRGDLLARLGRFDEARAEFERAASLARNAREHELLFDRAAECAAGSSSLQL